jgi:hypothetical protein
MVGTTAMFWYVLLSFSTAYMVAIERIDVYHQDVVVYFLVFYDSGYPTLLEIGNYL